MGPAKNLMVATIGLALGLFSVWLSFGAAPIGAAPIGAAARWNDRPRDEATEATEATETTNDDAPTAVEDAPAADSADDEAESDDIPAEPAQMIEPTEPVEDEEPRVAQSELRLRRGRLAYLRCGSLDVSDACPRDEEMEAEAWRVLEALTTCGRLQGGGSGDVRFRLGTGTTETRFRDYGDRPIPADDLLACLGETTAGVRTILPGEGIVVSFRFTLE